MKSSLLFNFSVDKENKTINIQREFNANLELVWKAWTEPELLNQWWAPKPYHIETKTLEAKIVQDADRTEALGAIGLARTFYVAGLMKTKLFCSEDPFATNRELDDKAYALDHFQQKLLKLPSTMKTEPARLEANKRANILYKFLDDLKNELYI